MLYIAKRGTFRGLYGKVVKAIMKEGDVMGEIGYVTSLLIESSCHSISGLYECRCTKHMTHHNYPYIDSSTKVRVRYRLSPITRVAAQHMP
jgi:hypothetical protein